MHGRTGDQDFLVVAISFAFSGSALGFLAAWFLLNEAGHLYHRRVAGRVSEDLRTQFVSASQIQLTLTGVIPCLLLLATPLFGMPWAFAVVLAICALGIPSLWARRLQQRRHQQFIAQLPEALLALASSLRAGANLSQAITLTGQRQPAPLGQEFALVQGRQRLGDDLNSALEALCNRFPSAELRLFKDALVISHQVGGDLAGTLETVSNTLRERAQIEEKVQALTAMGRLQGKVMCLLPLAIGGMLYLQQPDTMRRLFTDPMGWVVLGVISIMMTLAIFMIRRIVSIDV